MKTEARKGNGLDMLSKRGGGNGSQSKKMVSRLSTFGVFLSAKMILLTTTWYIKHTE